jgi:hypothetical protein
LDFSLLKNMRLTEEDIIATIREKFGQSGVTDYYFEQGRYPDGEAMDPNDFESQIPQPFVSPLFHLGLTIQVTPPPQSSQDHPSSDEGESDEV